MSLAVAQPISLSSAGSFFNDLKEKGEAEQYSFLSNIPASFSTYPFFEEEWIDFKGEPQNDKDAKKIWSKALSGYANITDGLVIWGIDARKTPTKDKEREIDAASGLRLVKHPKVFESNLRDWIRDATNPPVMGVEYISCTGPSGEGFIVCLVPESHHKPHRAEFADRHYYYRAGDDFLEAQPNLLRLLFYPQTQPYLWIEVSLSYLLKPRDLDQAFQKQQSIELFNKLLNGRSIVDLKVKLHNTGTATAKDVFVVLQTDSTVSSYHGGEWIQRVYQERHHAFQAMRSFHPGEVTDMFRGRFEKELFNKTIEPSSTFGIIPHFDKLQLHFLIYAENSRPQEVTLEFTPEDLDPETRIVTKNGYPVV